jgi:putative oxidoreductase
LRCARPEWTKLERNVSCRQLGTAESRAFANPIALLGRVLLSAIFVVEGYGKIVAYAGVADYMRSFGVSDKMLPLVIATELSGGLLVLVGYKTRWAATALAGFCALTAALFHNNFSGTGQMIEFQKDLSIAGRFLILVARGPGDWSIDAWRRRH